jgi:hypothetical protein
MRFQNSSNRCFGLLGIVSVKSMVKTMLFLGARFACIGFRGKLSKN